MAFSVNCDIYASSAVLGAGFKPVFTSVDINPLSSRCLTSVI